MLPPLLVWTGRSHRRAAAGSARADGAAQPRTREADGRGDTPSRRARWTMLPVPAPLPREMGTSRKPTWGKLSSGVGRGALRSSGGLAPASPEPPGTSLSLEAWPN